jgi:hypothetical protein
LRVQALAGSNQRLIKVVTSKTDWVESGKCVLVVVALDLPLMASIIFLRP